MSIDIVSTEGSPYRVEREDGTVVSEHATQHVAVERAAEESGATGETVYVRRGLELRVTVTPDGTVEEPEEPEGPAPEDPDPEPEPPPDEPEPEPTAPAYPHEPAGMTRVFRTDGSEKHFDGSWTYQLGWDDNVHVIDDSSNPTGSGKVMEAVTQPGSKGAGVATMNHFASGPQEELYIMYRVFYDPNLETNSGKQFYLGMHQDSRNNVSSPTQLYFVSYAGSGGGSSQFTQQNVSPTSNLLTCSSGCDKKFSTGRWQDFEVHLVAQSAPGVADGIIRLWINGEFVGENRTAEFVRSDDPDVRFDGLEWYFWQNDLSPNGDWERIGEFYISGKN